MRILIVLTLLLHTIITAQPTAAPTWTCPRYWFTGGTSQHICAKAGDRCSCHNTTTTDECCLLEPDFTNTYDPNRRHKSEFACKLDVELDEHRAGNSHGYSLTSNKNTTTHTFAINILPHNYPCQMHIHWRLAFDCIAHNRSKNCDTSNLLADAGLDVDVTSGKLKVWGQQDAINTTVQFTVTQQNMDLCDSTRLDAIYGYLEIVNATSECQPDCPDYRLYPMRIPVYYISSQEPCEVTAKQTQKNVLPLVWCIVGIAAFVIFLRLLAWLLHWYENKKREVVSGSVKAGLDVSVMQHKGGRTNINS